MRAYKSPTRLFAFGLLGLLLLIASIDVMFAHWVSTEPENTDGVLTTRGHAQQRGDIIWGAVMLGTGTALFAGAFIELIRREPQCVIAAGGIEIPMGKHGQDVTVPWSNIRDVRGDIIKDGFDGSMREQLVIEVLDTADLPAEPQGAQWNGNDLQVDAENWTKGVGEFAIAAQGALGHYRRVDEIKHMEAPSLTWHTSVEAAGDSADEQIAPGGEVEAEDADVEVEPTDPPVEPVMLKPDESGRSHTDAPPPSDVLLDDTVSDDVAPDDVLNGDEAAEPSDPEETKP